MLKIEENIYYIEDDYYSTEAPKLLKKKIPHNFALIVIVAPMVGGKQRKRKKKFKFRADSISILDAVKSIRSVPDDMKEALINGTESKAKEVVTLNKIWDDFLTYKLTTTTGKQWRHSTAKSIISTYNKWVRNTQLGAMNIDVIKRRHIIELLESIESVNIKNALLTALRPSIERYFELEEIERRNPAHITGLKQASPKEHTKLTIVQAGKLYAQMLSTDNLALRNATILIWQGRRLNEAITLSYSNVFSNLDTKEQYYKITEENSKTKVAVVYRLPSELCVTGVSKRTKEELEQEKINDTYNYKGIRNEYATQSSIWVCPSRFRGKPHITKAVLRDGYTKALKALGMPHMRLHDVRQIISSILQDAEVPLEVISMVLGHAGKGNVTKRYTGHSPDVAYKAYRFFIALISGSIDSNSVYSNYSIPN